MLNIYRKIMVIIKIKCYIIAFLKKIILNVLYGNRIYIAKRVTWRKNFNVIIGKKGKLTIGEDCFFNNDCSINCLNRIIIGNGSIFGENVKIYDHNHRFSNFEIPIKKQGFSYGEVIIGKHCWIGSNVVMLKGTKVGDNCVIAAGTVIDCDIPSNTIVKNSNLRFEKIRSINYDA